MPEIHPANPRARRLAIALVAISALGGSLLISFADSHRAVLETWVTSNPAQVDPRLRLVASGLGLAFAFPTLLCAGYLWRLGGRIVSFDRFPPPGMRVVRDTVVLSGQAAQWRGRALQLLAVILMLVAVGFGMILWRLTLLLEVRQT